MRRLKSTLIYLSLIGFAGSSALFLASAVLKKAHSQSKNALPPPSEGDLPAEFLQDSGKNEKPGKGAVPNQAPSAGQKATQFPAQAPSSGAAPGARPEAKASGIAEDPSAALSLHLAKEDFVYDPNGKRDPFRPIIVRQAKIEARPNVDVIEPLEKFVLAQLKVVAIMWETKNPRAVVRDPDGGNHIVSKNTKIGNNKGVISAIREGEIVVIEMVNRADGATRKEVQILSLKK